MPQYKGIKFSDILKFTTAKTNINRYLPKYDYEKESNRELICNLVNSLIPDKFLRFVKIKWKRKEILISSSLAVKVKPEFLDMFKSSLAISTINEKFSFPCKRPQSK